MRKPFWSRGMQPTNPVTAPPPLKPEPLSDTMTTVPYAWVEGMYNQIQQHERLADQVRAALRVYEADKTFNSTALVMADKLYDGLSALEGRGS